MATDHEEIYKVLKEVLCGLDDETVLEYMTGVVAEAGDEDYMETVAPFLFSTGFVTDEDEAQKICTKIKNRLSSIGFNEAWRQENSTQVLEVKKLDKKTVIEDLVMQPHDDQLMNRMWGFDKIRKQVNEQVDQKVAQSQRQIRKQIKVDKAIELKEEIELAADLEWENARILPDLTVATSERDIHVANVNISFKGLTLLTDTSLKLVDGRRYGLIGLNGTGKTTLLRYIARYEIEGFPKHVRIQQVEQEAAEKLSSSTKSVIQVVMEADYERQALLDQEKELIAANDDASQSQLNEIYTRLAAIDSDSVEARARTILMGLQFSPEMIDGPATDLSGGWRMRAALAGALFMSPDLLLLDEPTNHLDLEAVVWLETYLQSYQSTLVIVSHDRNFLDTVITDVIHLHNQKLNYYKGDYATFENTRKEQLRQQRKAYEAQQQKVVHMQDFIDRFRCNAKKAALVQSRIKALDKMELIEEPEDEQAFKMQFPPPEALGRPIISLTDVEFSYSQTKAGETSDRNPIFSDVNFSIDMQSRLGILGRNGSGKSTLINLILDKLRPSTGHIHLNPRLRIAAFTQHHVDQLNLAKSAVENMAIAFPGHESLEFRNHLGRFKVSGNMATKPTRKLSGGQKSRVAFAILTWRVPHVIVMDEPTNHLDIETIDALIDALNGYKGGVVIVSHDQHFVNSICNELWVVADGSVSRFRGGISDYKKLILH